MSAYSAAATLVLRSAVPRTAELLTPEPRVVEPVERRTRFTVVTTMVPFDGPAPCSVCPESGAIGQAIGGVRYNSTFLGGWADEPVCLPHLPELIRTLADLNEGPLEIALYSPCALANTPRVRRLDREREELVRWLVWAHGLPALTRMSQSLFAAATAVLHRVAGGGA